MSQEKTSAWTRAWKVAVAAVVVLFVVCLAFLITNVRRGAVWEFLCELHPYEGQVPERLRDYADVLISVIAAIIVALLSISITMYVFLKSALDRVIDENRYIADVASVYQTNTSTALFVTSLANMAPLFLSLGWHFFLEFKKCTADKGYNIFLWGVGLLLLLFLVDICITMAFWLRCLRLRKQLKNVIKKEKADCSQAMEQFLSDEGSNKNNAKDAVWFLIGYWDQWKTDAIDPDIEKCGGHYKWDPLNKAMVSIKKHGEDLCEKMGADQFIDLFSRTEALLMSGGNGIASESHDESMIVTVIQERQLLSDPTITVERENISDRRYHRITDGDTRILSFISAFREKVGYDSGDPSAPPETRTAFFHETEKMYKCLRRYSNLILSERDAVASGKKESETANSENGRPELPSSVSTCMYLLYLRVIALFVNAVRINDFTFNGNTLSFANFYNSSLSNVSFYDAQFYHTIFARTRLQQVAMDLSEFDNLFFYYTKFIGSSLNNSKFQNVIFENMQASDTDFSICVFSDCDFTESVINDSVFNGSRFQRSTLRETDFSQSQLCNISWSETSIENCSFGQARIRNWEWKTPDSIWVLKNCDFSDSIWEKMTICNANMSNSSFIGASLVEVNFKNTSLEGAIFLKCQLPNAVFKYCQELSQSSFQEANLFSAEFHGCTLEMANFYRASASNSIFDNCKLQHSDCSSMYFRNARLDTVDFTAARLYDTTLNWAEIKKCNFTHALADHLQFTFAKCEDTDFTYASMSDDCLSGTEFKVCTFLGSDLSGSAASKVSFMKSDMTQVDLTDVRLVDAVFSDSHIACCDLAGSQFCGGRIIQSQFNSCFFDHAVFSRVYFEDVVFSDCSFDRIFFQQCSFQRVKFIGCTIQSDGSRKEMTLVQLQNCMDPVNRRIVVEDNAYSL